MSKLNNQQLTCFGTMTKKTRIPSSIWSCLQRAIYCYKCQVH